MRFVCLCPSCVCFVLLHVFFIRCFSFVHFHSSFLSVRCLCVWLFFFSFISCLFACSFVCSFVCLFVCLFLRFFVSLCSFLSAFLFTLPSPHLLSGMAFLKATVAATLGRNSEPQRPSYASALGSPPRNQSLTAPVSDCTSHQLPQSATAHIAYFTSQ